MLQPFKILHISSSMYRIKEASCYKVVSVGELAGFDSPIHLCPWYSLRQRLVALLHMCRKILSSNIVSRWKSWVNVPGRAIYWCSSLPSWSRGNAYPAFRIITYYDGSSVVRESNPALFSYRTHLENVLQFGLIIHSRQTDIHPVDELRNIRKPEVSFSGATAH